MTVWMIVAATTTSTPSFDVVTGAGTFAAEFSPLPARESSGTFALARVAVRMVDSLWIVVDGLAQQGGAGVAATLEYRSTGWLR